jgi:hypothetical protein
MDSPRTNPSALAASEVATLLITVDQLREEARRKRSEAERLVREVQDLDSLIFFLRRVRVIGDHVVQEPLGLPSQDSCPRYEVSAPRYNRTAQVYPNCLNKGGTYGLNLSGAGCHAGGTYRGAAWTYEEAVGGALLWVLHGEVVPDRYRTLPEQAVRVVDWLRGVAAAGYKAAQDTDADVRFRLLELK